MAPLSSTVADSPRSGIDPTLLKLRPRPGPRERALDAEA